MESNLYKMIVRYARSQQWRRWWLKFLETFIPKDEIDRDRWKAGVDYYSIMDYTSNAKYSLFLDEGIFAGEARVWLNRNKIYGTGKLFVSLFKEILENKNIEANVKVEHLPDCIYEDIIVETNYKSMDRDMLIGFREAFCQLDDMSYRGYYFVKYHGEFGTILFQCSLGFIIRAIRIEPEEEFYLYEDCGFHSEEARGFIERGVDWTHGSYTLISAKDFFAVWREKLTYKDKEDAVSFFEQASLWYFIAVSNGDQKGQSFSSWDIKNAANYLIAHDDKDSMINLIRSIDQSKYWAARLFADIVPEEARSAALWLVENCDKPYIVELSEKLVTKIAKR